MRQSVWMGALLGVLVVSNVACVAGPRFTRCPGEGGREWMELDSERYTLHTDLPADEARKAMGYLERTHVAILAAAWPAALRKEMVKVSVIVLADSSEFEGLFPRRLEAFFLKDDNEPVIVLHGSPDTWQRRFTGLSDISSSALKHELAHHLSTYVLIRQPRWLAEGLAQFLETLHLSEDGKTAVLGTPHLEATSQMKLLLDASERGLLRDDWTMSDVLAWDSSSESDTDLVMAGRYSGSWLLVHWLYNTRSEAFADYQAQLAQGDDPDSSLRATLPDLYARSLDSVLLEYLKRGSYQELTVQVPPVSSSFAERPLEDAEVHATRSKLAAMAAGMAEQQTRAQTREKLAKAELTEAIRLEPQGVLALRTKAAIAPEHERAGIARAAVAAHPDESAAWLLLATSLPRDAASRNEREEALRKALALAPRHVSAANRLAWMLVTEGRFAEALPIAKRAVSLAPWSPHVLDTYAMASAGVGACAEAILAERRAIDLLQEHRQPELEKVLRSRLAALGRESCQPPELEP
ncbi:DUF1570 domain-containing protein [Pyxidicoccus caerfyrddinensis]|uniref:DUF1570 domain-containing protein n=1 Tax=Pyxidicoccus caerfyrddinensis TaxID=2709663 RepID=UPI0013DCE52D|nr:DUF1570 domain-containing protein [Pyxidicoccus caerfyrddinensis]